MNSYIQVYLVFISFIFGFIFYLLARFNMWIIHNFSTFLKYLITFIFVIDMVFIYIYIVFSINRGIFHFYYSLLIFLGYYIALKIYPRILNKCQIILKKLKF